MTVELWTSLLTIIGVWLVTVVSPGPNFIATMYAASTRSRRTGLQVAAGITIGTAIWAAASLLGLAVLFEAAGWLYLIAKYAGAAYLIFLGIKLILSARTAPRPIAATTSLQTPGRAFRLGLLTDLSNPKAAAFFTSLFAVAVPPAAPLWFDILILSSVVAIAGGWYTGVAMAATWPPIARRYHRVERGLRRIAGGLFVAFGLKLAADR